MRLVALAVGAVLLTSTSAMLAYGLVAARQRVPEAAPQTVAVSRGTLTSTMTTTGTAYASSQAQLSFTSAAAVAGGTVRTVEAGLGEQVAAGQALVTLDNRGATRAVEQASASLEAARIAYDQLAVAAPSDVAGAAQVVAAANASYQRALNDRSTLRRGSGADSIAAASEAALSAQNALAAAQTDFEVLQSRGTALASAETLQREIDANIRQLNAAESDVERLLAGTESARFLRPAIDDLTKAVEERCKDLGYRDACVDLARQSADLAGLVGALSAQTQGVRDLAPLEADLRRALAGAPVAGLDDAVFRQAQALAARAGLQVRHDAAIFTITPFGAPSPDELLNAARARDAARQAANAAQERLRTLTAGATIEELGNADQAVSAARASLDAALAAQAAVGGGGSPLALQQQRVLLAESALRSAQDALEDIVLRSPFAGVVAALDVREGDAVTPNVPVVTVTDPAAVSVRVAASETEVGTITSGQPGVARFEALGNASFLVTVTGVAGVPKAQAGPATFEVQARVLTGRELAAANIEPVLGLLGLTPAATEAERAAVRNRLAQQTPPRPGMTASVALAQGERTGILLVPNTAIRRDAIRPSVEVVSSSGDRTERRVTLGTSDGRMTEIVSGLTEGERVVERVGERLGASAR